MTILQKLGKLPGESHVRSWRALTAVEGPLKLLLVLTVSVSWDKNPLLGLVTWCQP